MKKRNKITWAIGDVFGVPLVNDKFVIGQILGQSMTNTVRVALYDETINQPQNIDTTVFCNDKNLISLIEVTKEQLDYGVWKILGNRQVSIPINRQPNEKYRQLNWVGMTIQDAALVEDFLNAFYSLIAWDDWFDPSYLDKLLVDISKKPDKLILTKQ
jgi:hypothetical protein